jgi:hemerythrin superfamily protein
VAPILRNQINTFKEVPMDALELLKQDHQKVKELFKQGQQTEDKKQQKQIFKEIKAELETHARIEETIFYPAMEEHDELKDMVLESLEEHRQMKTVLRELGKLSASSERFKPKFKVLMDDVKHHAEEEEEGKMFPKIRNLVKGDELRQLGEELEAAKHKRLRKAS